MSLVKGKGLKALLLVMVFILGLSTTSLGVYADGIGNDLTENSPTFNGFTTEEIDEIVLADEEDIELTEEEEEMVEELSGILELIKEEAIVYKNGVETLDIDVLEEAFGEVPEIKEIEEVLSSSTITAPKGMQRANAVDKCVTNKIKAAWKESFSVYSITTLINFIKKGQYTNAAKRLIKLGIKGNAAGIAVQLSYYLLTCEYKHNGWW